MRRLALALGVALAVGGAQADDFGAASLPLEGATFGMSTGAWRAPPVPASAGPTAVPMCWTHQQPVSVPGYTLSAEDKRTDLTTCAYLSRFGSYVLPHSVRLDSRFSATGLRFLFVRDRLSEVEFRTSVDAYNDVMALLTKRFGPPTRTDRDTIVTELGRTPRVRQLWQVRGGKIELVDPSADLTRLGVVLQLAPARRA